MTEPVYTTATIITYNCSVDDYGPYFFEFRIEKKHMLVNSIVHSAEHPVYIRHWTNVEDAQAWVDTVQAFAAEYGFDVRGRVEPIETTT